MIKVLFSHFLFNFIDNLESLEFDSCKFLVELRVQIILDRNIMYVK